MSRTARLDLNIFMFSVGVSSARGVKRIDTPVLRQDPGDHEGDLQPWEAPSNRQYDAQPHQARFSQWTKNLRWQYFQLA